MKLFVPLWHMPESAVSGGLYRTKRLLETMRAYDVVVADSDTTDIDARAVNGRVIIYPARRLYAFSRSLFPVLRVLNWSWSCLALIAIGLTARDTDAVYAPNSELPHVSLAAWFIAKVRRVPVVFGNLNVRGTELWPLNRLLHRRVDAIITLSQALAEELRAEGIDVPIYVGTVGVDDRRPAQPLPKIYDAIYVARHTAEKGVLDLLQIVERCAARMPQLRVAMVGPCSDAMLHRITEIAHDRGIEHNIEMLGQVPEDEKWRLYARSRLCVFPSHVEGWGIVPIEAHLCGLPVVAYNLPAYRETILGSPAATLVPDGDVDAFANAVLEVLQAGFCGAAAARTWAAQFTWERAARLEEALLRGALHEPDSDLAAVR